MDFKTCISVLNILPNDLSILLRGKHGIGKSQVVYQIAEGFAQQLNQKVDAFVIERRLSQMSEGDMIGLPELVDGITRFAPPDWFMDCCRNPRVLFLDEFNRATPEVMQAAFQIVLDRKLNGHALHPETRVYAAINHSMDYIINDMDPALLDRFWVVDLEPTPEDWFSWAKEKGKIDELVYDFLFANRSHLEHNGNHDPGKVYPSRRSWDRLNRALLKASLMSEPENPLFYNISIGLVGSEASISLTEYAKNRNREITAEDILVRWSKVKNKIDALGPEKWNILNEKIGDHVKEHKITKTQAKNLAEYFKALPGEHAIQLWTVVAMTGPDNIKALHELVWRETVDLLHEKSKKEEEEKASGAEAEKPKKSK